MLFTELAPKAQIKYHAEVLPVLVNLMINEPLLKMQTQATSAVLNFVQGLFNDENDDSKDEETPDCRELMSNYTKPLLQALVELLKKGIQAKHEPLQTEVLNVLHSVCSVILADFGIYYNDFMPLMTEIL